MRILYESKLTVVESLTILFVITECLSIPKHVNCLSSTASSLSRQEIVSAPKIGSVQKEKFLENTNEEDRNGGSGRNEGVAKEDRRSTKSSSRTSRQGPKIWDHWGSWSSCSVTCGIGKLTRWRHCIGGNCSLGEKKAQLKTCTLAAC